MESTIRRNRSVRSNYSNYSRRRMGNANSILNSSHIIKQAIVCTAIFMIALTIKNIDNSFTKNLSNKAYSTLRTDIEVNSVIDSFKNYFTKLSVVNAKIKDVFNSKVTPEDTAVIPENMKDKIYDYNLLKGKQFALPTNGTLSSGFGMRVNPITKKDEFHAGVDVSAGEGENIYSVLDGEVIDTGNDISYGNYIKINHGDDLKTLYAHASLIEVEKGESVKKGEIIGKVGSTGEANGPHVHLEIWKGDQMVNPEKVLNFNNKEVIYN